MSPKSGLRISGADGRRRRVADEVAAWLGRDPIERLAGRSPPAASG